MAYIGTGNWPKLLMPGLERVFGLSYNELPPQYPDLYEKRSSKQKFEEAVQATSFPLARKKDEGQGIQYVTDSQGYLVRTTHVTYALGYIVSWEEEQDNLYKEVAMKRAGNLGFSMRQAKEILAATPWNQAFASKTGGDGVYWISASHPTPSGLQSNLVSAALSESAIEDMMVQIMNTTNEQGFFINLQGVSLHVPPALWYEAHRILKSVLQNDTSLNAVNVLRAENALAGGIKRNNYFTDSDAWFVRTNCPDGLVYFERNAIMFGEDNDFDTKNHKFSAMERYSFNQYDWRSLFGSAGA